MANSSLTKGYLFDIMYSREENWKCQIDDLLQRVMEDMIWQMGVFLLYLVFQSQLYTVFMGRERVLVFVVGITAIGSFAK